MLTYGIDVDDVLMPFVPIACELANEENPGLNASPEDIKNWGFAGNKKIDVVSQYYGDIRTYERQHASDEAKEFIKKLMKKGKVYIITAVSPRFMGIRAEQIRREFSDFPEENIIMGSNKSIVKFDITLDDGPNNILKSCAKFPVLFRQPWNQSLSGMLSVNNYEEFFQMIEQIKSSMVEDKQIPVVPSVIALVGPSGSNKNELAKALEEKGLAERVFSYATGAVNDNDNHWKVSEEQYNETDFVSKTVYAGVKYGIHRCDIEKYIKNGTKCKNVVIPTDICGAIALKRSYPTTIIFCRRSRENMIASILEKNMSNEEKKWRLLSMENELKNEELCDYAIRTEDVEDAAEQIARLFRMNMIIG